MLRCRRAWDPRPPKRVDDAAKSDGVVHVAANIVVVVVVVVVRTEKKKKKKKKKKNEIGKWR